MNIESPKIDLELVQKLFEKEGYAHIRSFLSREEVEEIREAFAEIHKHGIPGVYSAHDGSKSPHEDPLEEYPRVMHPHRYNDIAKKYLLHPQSEILLNKCMGEEPIAVQSMYYFKPPGARGQALHQDNFYLQVKPGTCMAVWIAIDPTSAENGGMMVVPETHDGALVCPDLADEKISFSKQFVPVPKGKKPVLISMEPGDALIFNGSVIHGSGPNRSKTLFRRSFICHYTPASTKNISKFYSPALRMSGEPLELELSEGGGPCGAEWTGATH
jgi:phytanoyl-CoA hydroxylase